MKRGLGIFILVIVLGLALTSIYLGNEKEIRKITGFASDEGEDPYIACEQVCSVHSGRGEFYSFEECMNVCVDFVDSNYKEISTQEKVYSILEKNIFCTIEGSDYDFSTRGCLSNDQEITNSGPSVSATWNDRLANPIERAIDNNVNTFYSACQYPSWKYNGGEVIYDLGEVKQLNKIMIDFHQQFDPPNDYNPLTRKKIDYPTDSPSIYEVQVSRDKSSWKTISKIETKYLYYGVWKYKRSPDKTIILDKEDVRYVKISYSKVNDGTGWCAGINEISYEEYVPPSPLTASWNDNSKHPINFALDGDDLTYYASCPSPYEGFGAPEYKYYRGNVTYDLGSVKNISKLYLDFHQKSDYPEVPSNIPPFMIPDNERDDYIESPLAYKILVSDDGKNWRIVNSIRMNEKDSFTEAPDKTFDYDGYLQTRYFMIDYLQDTPFDSVLKRSVPACFGLNEINVTFVLENESDFPKYESFEGEMVYSNWNDNPSFSINKTFDKNPYTSYFAGINRDSKYNSGYVTYDLGSEIPLSKIRIDFNQYPYFSWEDKTAFYDSPSSYKVLISLDNINWKQISSVSYTEQVPGGAYLPTGAPDAEIKIDNEIARYIKLEYSSVGRKDILQYIGINEISVLRGTFIPVAKLKDFDFSYSRTSDKPLYITFLNKSAEAEKFSLARQGRNSFKGYTAGLTVGFERSLYPEYQSFMTESYLRFIFSNSTGIIEDFLVYTESISDPYSFELEGGNYNLDVYECGNYIDILNQNGIDTSYETYYGVPGEENVEAGNYLFSSIDVKSTDESIKEAEISGELPPNYGLSKNVINQIKASCLVRVESLSMQISGKDSFVSEDGVKIGLNLEDSKSDSGDSGEYDLFFDEEKIVCKGDELLIKFNEYLASCTNHKSLYEEHESEKYGNCEENFGILFSGRIEDDPQFEGTELKNKCVELRNELQDCRINTGNGNGGGAYGKALLTLSEINTGNIAPIDPMPCNIFEDPEIFGYEYTPICSNEWKARYEACKKSKEVSARIRINETLELKKRGLNALVGFGKFWSDSPIVTEPAKINYLKTRAENPSYIYPQSKIDEGYEMSELEKFQISMTYYLRRFGGAYNLAKEHYGFKEFTDENRPSFLNDESAGVYYVGDKKYDCSGGTCFSLNYLVHSFWHNTITNNNMEPSCEDIYNYLWKVINAKKNSPTRILSPSLYDVSTCDYFSLSSCIIHKKVDNYDNYKYNKFFKLANLPSGDFYLKLMDTVTLGDSALVSFHPLDISFYGIFAYYRLRWGGPSHSLLVLDVDSEGNFLVYDSNFNENLIVRAPKVDLDTSGKPRLQFGIREYQKSLGSFIAFHEEISIPSSFKLYTKNCAYEGICDPVVSREEDPFVDTSY